MSTWTEPVQCIAAGVASQAAAAHQGRVNTMGRTIADALKAEGQLSTWQEALQIRLEEKFGPLPAELVQRIAATTDAVRLKDTFRQVSHMNTLDELHL